MDILQFINSKDERKYLKDIDYQFSTLEAAWIIYHSINHSLYEKFDAYEELMKCYPDCKVEKRLNTVPQDSLFEYIKKYIAQYKELIADFKAGDGLYLVTMYYKDGLLSNDYVQRLFSDYDSAVEQCKYEFYDDVHSMWIEKLPVINEASKDIPHSASVKLCLKNFEIMDVSYGLTHQAGDYLKYDILMDVFPGLWFDIPTPFKTGDIVKEVTSYDEYPMVIDEVGFDGLTEKHYKRLKELGDESDMTFTYYSVYPSDCTLFDDISSNYMDLEYCTDLKGKDKILIPISYFLKGKIDVGLCCNVFHSLIMREHTKDSMPHSYEQGILEEMGIDKEKIYDEEDVYEL